MRPGTLYRRQLPAGNRQAENGEHEETDYRLKGVLPMADNKQHDTRTTRRPDCVTEIRMGNSVLVPAISRKTPQPQPPTKWRGYWKRKPLLHRSRLIRREPGHGKSGHAGERGRWKSFFRTMLYLMYKERHNIYATNQKNYIFIRTKNHRFYSCKPPNR